MTDVVPRVLVIAGSGRTGSYNRALARAAAQSLRGKGFAVFEPDLRDCALPVYDADLEAASGVPAGALALHEALRTSRGVFLASPEYNAGVAPLLKNAIDWVSRVREHGGIDAAFGGPVFALGAASPGGLGGYRGLMMLRQVLELGLGARVLPEMVSVPRAHEAFDEAGRFRAPAQAQGLDRVTGALARALERTSAG